MVIKPSVKGSLRADRTEARSSPPSGVGLRAPRADLPGALGFGLGAMGQRRSSPTAFLSEFRTLPNRCPSVRSRPLPLRRGRSALGADALRSQCGALATFTRRNAPQRQTLGPAATQGP